MSTASTTPETTEAPAPGTPEHDAALAAKFDNAQVADAGAAKPERPADIPEEFWDAATGAVKQDALLAAYKALSTKPEGTEEAAEGGTADKPAGTVGQIQTEAVAALKEVGLAYEKYEAEFNTTGKLSDETYAEMAAKNIPRAVVDAHVASLVRAAELEAETIRADVFSTVGGEQRYGEMSSWAAKNLSPAEITAYNEITESGDPSKVKLAVGALFAKFEAAVGAPPNLLDANGQGSGADVYRSTQQLVADMKDPRYDRDPAFRADVEAKLARSNIM